MCVTNSGKTTGYFLTGKGAHQGEVTQFQLFHLF